MNLFEKSDKEKKSEIFHLLLYSPNYPQNIQGWAIPKAEIPSPIRVPAPGWQEPACPCPNLLLIQHSY